MNPRPCPYEGPALPTKLYHHIEVHSLQLSHTLEMLHETNVRGWRMYFNMLPVPKQGSVLSSGYWTTVRRSKLGYLGTTIRLGIFRQFEDNRIGMICQSLGTHSLWYYYHIEIHYSLLSVVAAAEQHCNVLQYGNCGRGTETRTQKAGLKVRYDRPISSYPRCLTCRRRALLGLR